MSLFLTSSLDMGICRKPAGRENGNYIVIFSTKFADALFPCVVRYPMIKVLHDWHKVLLARDSP